MACDYCQAYQAYLNAFGAYRTAYDSYVLALTGQGSKSKVHNFVPLVLANGGIQYSDRNGNDYFKSFRYANGELAYVGTEVAFQRLMGRSELDRVGPKMKDGLFSND